MSPGQKNSAAADNKSATISQGARSARSNHTKGESESGLPRINR